MYLLRSIYVRFLHPNLAVTAIFGPVFDALFVKAWQIVDFEVNVRCCVWLTVISSQVELYCHSATCS